MLGMGPLDADYAQHVYDLAPQAELDPLMVLAMIDTESAGCRWVTRYEPNWAYFTQIERFARTVKPNITVQTERMLQATSWGLMQIMGAVARELGHDGHIPELLQPRVNILFGTKKLQALKRPGYSTDDQIAAYNAGRVVKLSSGLYQNQVYVDRVRSKWNQLKLLGQTRPMIP